LDDRYLNFRGALPMVYPLPFVLQSLWSKMKDFKKIYYANCSTIQKKKLEWASNVTAQEYRDENNGKTISKKTCRDQKALYEAYCESYTPSERFMSCISAMARSQVNGSYPVVLVAALLSLVHPFYSGKHELGYPSLRKFRIDIFWFMSRAFCTFYAQLDLPLVCLFMARQNIGPLPCLSERMRYALCYQNIAIHYGHWKAADSCYDEWHDKVPLVSWLYEEFFYSAIVGLLWRMENLLIEMYINGILHRECKATCLQRHFNAPLSTLKQLNQNLFNITIRATEPKDAKENFLKNILIVCHLHMYYNITIEKIESEDKDESRFDERLQKIEKELSASTEFCSSRHFAPFVQILPCNLSHNFFWKRLIEKNTIHTYGMLQSFSLLDVPKTYADRLFSLVVSMLYHNRFDSFPHVIEATLTAYLKSTAGRHYRIPLLHKLLQVYKAPLLHQLHITNNPDPHSILPPSMVSAIGMTLTDIEAFSFTARDARNDFANIELSQDEKFIMYMKQRDPLMPAWIDLGLDCIRFSDCL